MLHGLFPIFGILIAFIIIVAVAKYFLSPGGRKTNDYPYQKETVLFSPAERSFFGVLEQAVNNRLRIMGKVRLADVVKVKSGMTQSARQGAFNRIQGKHIDFVACDPSTLSVQFAIELDDRSHNNSNRQKRDEFVDKVLQAAGIPIYHFTAKQTYSVEDIRNTLFDGEMIKKT